MLNRSSSLSYNFECLPELLSWLSTGPAAAAATAEAPDLAGRRQAAGQHVRQAAVRQRLPQRHWPQLVQRPG